MEKTSKITGGKLTRQRSRLQMHAPSSIQVVHVAPTPADVAEWKVAIPLLSPLDIVSLPSGHWDATAEDDREGARTRQPSDEEQERRAVKWATWQHPAALLYCEPVAGSGPAFLSPHCA